MVTYAPATRRDSVSINPETIDLEAALGLETGSIEAESGDAVPLGFGGFIILDFSPNVIVNSEGPDIRVVEITGAHVGQPWEVHPEEARVFASVDGERWIDIGIARKDTMLDLGDLSFARYIYIQDISNIDSFESAWANGFDVGAVEGAFCEERPLDPTAIPPTATATATSSPTITLPPATATVTASATRVPTIQPTPTATDTQLPTSTPTPTATITSSPTATVTITQTSTPTATSNPTSTITAFPTETATTTPIPPDTATAVEPTVEVSAPTETLTTTPSVSVVNTETPLSTTTITPLAATPDCAATTIVSFQPGMDHYGQPLLSAVSAQALGSADQQYVAIGIGGVLTLGLPPEMALNESGDDIRIVAKAITGTAAFIFASEDAQTWTSLGIATDTGSTTFDLNTLPQAQYIQIRDNSDMQQANGFTVDAVEAFNCITFATPVPTVVVAQETTKVAPTLPPLELLVIPDAMPLAAQATEPPFQIHNSQFDSNISQSGSGGAVVIGAETVIEGSVLLNNQAFEDGGAVSYTGGGLTLTGNCIAGNYEDSALEAATAAPPVVAGNNWWGATDGPGEVGSGDTVSANVTVVPATSPLTLQPNLPDCTELFVPQINSLTPANGAMSVTIDTPMQLVFDRPVSAGTGNITLHDTTGPVEALNVGSSAVTISNNTVILNFAANLTSNTDYHILIDRRALMDDTGEVDFPGIQDSTGWSFSTSVP
ncbi:MAG: Ig-like domain-containing protein, partial [Chloroflexota bacterium]